MEKEFKQFSQDFEGKWRESTLEERAVSPEHTFTYSFQWKPKWYKRIWWFLTLKSK